MNDKTLIEEYKINTDLHYRYLKLCLIVCGGFFVALPATKALHLTLGDDVYLSALYMLCAFSAGMGLFLLLCLKSAMTLAGSISDSAERLGLSSCPDGGVLVVIMIICSLLLIGLSLVFSSLLTVTWWW